MEVNNITCNLKLGGGGGVGWNSSSLKKSVAHLECPKLVESGIKQITDCIKDSFYPSGQVLSTAVKKRGEDDHWETSV